MASSTALSFDKFLSVWRNGAGKKKGMDWYFYFIKSGRKTCKNKKKKERKIMKYTCNTCENTVEGDSLPQRCPKCDTLINNVNGKFEPEKEDEDLEEGIETR